MGARSTADTVLGIVLLVLGILVLVGRLGIPFFTEILGIALIVVGVLMLVGKMRGANWIGILLVAGGIILLATDWLGRLVGALEAVAEIIIGVLLVVAGVLKLMGKW